MSKTQKPAQGPSLNANQKQPKKFSELVIKEIMFQKGISREAALKILEENHR